MKYPKVNFIVKDSRREAEYICFLAKSISDGNYQRGGFLVLPKPIEDNFYSVYFPNLKYSKDFWRAISSSKNSHLGQNFPEAAVDEVVEKIPMDTAKTLSIKNKFIKDWKKIESNFFSIYSEFIDISKTLPKINSIDVLLTEYGTRGSFYVHQNGGIKIYLTKRIDLSLDYFIRTILLSTLTIKSGVKSEIGHLPWYYRQTLIDLLLSETVFNKLLKNRKFNNSISKSKTDILIKSSNKYLNNLGFDYSEIFDIDPEGKVLVNNTDTEHIYTKQELSVLKELIKHKNSTVNFDRIAGVLWGRKSLEKFSFYSMSKVIENIRKKTRSLGINKEVLLNVRGKGYLLRE